MPSSRVRQDSLGDGRRFRFDPVATARRPDRRPTPGDRRERSGRRIVAAGILTILAVWTGLYLAFRDWRKHARERIAYGQTEVAPTIDALHTLEPPDVAPADWHQAVRATHEMLVTVTSSNAVSLADLRALHIQLQAVVARARAQPATARAELNALWLEMANKAGHIIDRHPRPKILQRGTRNSS